MNATREYSTHYHWDHIGKYSRSVPCSVHRNSFGLLVVITSEALRHTPKLQAGSDEAPHQMLWEGQN